MKLGDFKGRAAGIGPQIGFIFPLGESHQGAFNVRAYKDFIAENRPEAFTVFVSFAITPGAPPSAAPKHMITE